MLRAPLLLAVLAAFASTASAETYLLTAFEPFAGRPDNRSQEVARLLAERIRAKRADAHVEICTLPVVYDLAAEVAGSCLMALGEAPTLMLSLGEGSCEIHLETRARNLDDTPDLADNGGNLRAGSAIEPDAPEYVALHDALAANLRLLTPTERKRVRVSDDAGAFVCNNTAYHMARWGQDHPDWLPRYAFVHVPPSGCGTMSDDAANAAVLAKLLAL